VKIYINLYKKLLLLSLTILFFHNIQTKEEQYPEEVIEETENIDSYEIMFRGGAGINNKDLANFCAMLAKQTIHQITGGNLENNLTSISDTIDEIKDLVVPLNELNEIITPLQENLNDLETAISGLTAIANNILTFESIINNLSITAQLGLINTSVSNPALTQTLVVSNFNVETYNNNISTALIAVTIAINNPSINNTATAQSLLTAAINNFNNIIIDYNQKSVMSMYSLAEIYTALFQLNAQLGYLYILQGS